MGLMFLRSYGGIGNSVRLFLYERKQTLTLTLTLMLTLTFCQV